MPPSLPLRMQADLRAGDTVTISVLRTTLAAIANAGAVDPSLPTTRAGLGFDVERKELSDLDIRRVVVREQDEHRAAAAAMRQTGHDVSAAGLDQRAAILASYLPA